MTSTILIQEGRTSRRVSRIEGVVMRHSRSKERWSASARLTYPNMPSVSMVALNGGGVS
jgi:hypothetical protein